MIKCERGTKQSSKDATKGSDKHSVIWGMFMSSTLQASVFMVKNCSDNWHSIRNTEDLTLKQMFDIFWEIDIRTIRWDLWSGKTLHGSICLWLVMNKSSVSCTQRSTYSQNLYCVVERWTRTLNQILHGKTDWFGSKVHQNTELWTELMVSQWNSSGTSSQDSPHCRSATKSKSYCQDWAEHQRNLLNAWSSCR